MSAEGPDILERPSPVDPVAEVSRRDTDLEATELGLRFLERHDTLGLVEVERTQHPGIEGGEGRGVGAESQGQDEDDRQGPAWALAEHAAGEADVLDEPIEHPAATCVAYFFLYSLERAEAEIRLSPRLPRVETRTAEQIDLVLDVEAELLVHVSVLARALEDRPDPFTEDREPRHAIPSVSRIQLIAVAERSHCDRSRASSR